MRHIPDREWCKCGKPRTQEINPASHKRFLSCDTCLARGNRKRSRKLALPDDAPPAPLRVDAPEGNTRALVLEEVRERWLALPNVGAFTAWLKTELEKSLGRRVH